ncbi:hypothetical protein DPEC_G00100280 [Dallia pectoralis]|uniref:Uncharacterized protein n=1 Tax=Dallia pectoralis TaxID=75939 RepID=A0ACC2GW72_DALPE|nr:hypothetical protein DPEC_G00100280 [Dallia pectoralis]
MHCHILIAVVLWSISIDSQTIRGISLSYKRFYRERKSFLCIDGSKLIPFDQVNDDYCDCVDGSDEPGTAACPGGRFYCTNLGYRPHYIPSSRVNDAICDCCDASDEYNSHTLCQNTCRDLGQTEREEVKSQMKALDEGLRLKQELIQEGIQMWQDKQAQLRDLQRVSDDLQTQLDDLRKEDVRRKEEVDALRELVNSHRGHNSTESPVSESDRSRDGSVTVKEVQAKLADIQAEGRDLSEDGAIIRGSSVPGQPAEEEDPVVKAAISAAEKAAAELKRIEDAYEAVYMEIRDLREKLATDFGPEREFLFLHIQCFHQKVNEYFYELCPFNQVTQTSASGAEVSLGKWGSWADSRENRYGQMKYVNGEPCWQGPTRNTVVTLTCGTETAMRSVKEPSKCQYAVEFQTPVACRLAQRGRGIHSEL